MNTRVMMIGMDAGSLAFIKSSLPSLPNLRRAMGSGIVRTLRSRATELLHAAAWPTFYTGTSPGTHGFYYPMQWDAERMRLRDVGPWFYCEPFWHDLERRGYRVVALDVPMTWPSRLRHGIEVTDWGAHDALTAFSAQPAHLEADIRRRFGNYPIKRETPVRKSLQQLARMRDELVAGARRKGELACWLLAQRDWDFSITVFGETHRAGHLFWPSPGSEGSRHPQNALLEVYRAVDEGIGKILNGTRLSDTTLIIFSAHGMSENVSHEHFTRRIMDRVNQRYAGASAGRSRRRSGPRQRSLMRFLRERLPASVQHAMGQAVPQRIQDFVVDRAVTAGHDWTQTPGLAILASVTGYVRFNLRGREIAGMLEPGSAAFADYVRWTQECFHSFRIVDSGAPLVSDVTLTERVFPGARNGYLPDMVISWADVPPASRIHSDLLGTIEAQCPTGRAGNHHPDGFSIVVESGGARGVVAECGDVRDMKPLVYRRLGVQA